MQELTVFAINAQKCVCDFVIYYRWRLTSSCTKTKWAKERDMSHMRAHVPKVEMISAIFGSVIRLETSFFFSFFAASSTSMDWCALAELMRFDQIQYYSFFFFARCHMPQSKRMVANEATRKLWILDKPKSGSKPTHSARAMHMETCCGEVCWRMYHHLMPTMMWCAKSNAFSRIIIEEPSKISKLSVSGSILCDFMAKRCALLCSSPSHNHNTRCEKTAHSQPAEQPQQKLLPIWIFRYLLFTIKP